MNPDTDILLELQKIRQAGEDAFFSGKNNHPKKAYAAMKSGLDKLIDQLEREIES